MSSLPAHVSDAAFRVVRDQMNASGYGGFVTDERCRDVGDAVAISVMAVLASADPIDPKQPLAPR